MSLARVSLASSSNTLFVADTSPGGLNTTVSYLLPSIRVCGSLGRVDFLIFILQYPNNGNIGIDTILGGGILIFGTMADGLGTSVA